ncbi:MAG: PIN/TRAM domain-containing protein, partial [Planctomycetota bacterium]|nr:PIN/TRAM domain-containing protein [Planctomycetota bacterium]
MPLSPIRCFFLGCIPAFALAQSAWFLTGPGQAIALILLWPIFAVTLILKAGRGQIPVVEDTTPKRTWILDTSIFIDGRLLELLKFDLIPGAFLVPEFVLGELQHLADRSDKNRRERGRRGLDIASEMQKLCPTRWTIHKDTVEGETVDEKLINLATLYPGRLA